MIEHALFPTLICEFEYDKVDEFKTIFYEHAFEYMSPDGYSDESTGHVNLHHNLAFTPLFTFVSGCINKYLDRLHIDRDLFDINIVKSWMNIKKDGANPKHDHRDAHISFTYYVNIPDNINIPIRFYNYADRHEPYPGLLRFNNTSDVWDSYNAYTWQFFPKEGTLFIFPASLSHDTVGNAMHTEIGVNTIQELNMRRICLAADVLMTYKKTSTSALGLQPIHNWRTF